MIRSEARRLSTLRWLLVSLAFAGCGTVAQPPCKSAECSDAGALLDAGANDAGALDAGSFDAGGTDAGPSDAGDLDAGLPDAGDAVDALMLAKLAEASALFATSSATLWGLADGGSYRFDRLPTYMVRRDHGGANQRGYLLHAPAPTGAFPLAAPASLGVVLRYDGALAALGVDPFNQELPLGTGTVFGLAYGLPSGALEHPGTSDFLQYVVHEGFHRYQIAEGAWREHASWFAISETGYPLTEQHLAHCLLEDAILAAAVTDASLTATTAAEALRNFAAVRAARAALADAVAEGVNATAYDTAGEQIEGTALYLETQFRSASVHGPFDRAFLAQYLDSDLMPLTSRADALGYFGQGRTYGTGAAQGYLLDVAGQRWRDDMPGGSGPYDVVRAHYAPTSTTDRDTRVQALKLRFDFEGALRTKARTIAALP